ncbi:hypothetical protein JRQ81_012927 [Phrynocephalus forsythii]|uniref:Laminin G domain-containing protein n=1 Tax=Phrynocephalus forsythii TaxID=171643 RepID=A0A9Q0XZ69_9SAUR|nr:hypothetical protein JRQ81_012927 [Phrynocephalus forsythii]
MAVDEWGCRSALLLLLLALHGEAAAVSFFGESYVQLSIPKSSTTSLKFHFLTSRPDGLLFLGSGKEACFVVMLHSGNIHVRINFGAGDHAIHSQWASHLNDLTWHLVEIHHEQDNITLLVDKTYQASIKLPDVLSQLNMEHGLFVGGTGSLEAPYFNATWINFRGCIRDVIFNNHDILTSLRPSLRLKTIHEVSLGCSDEFLAGDEEPISFFSSKSYVSFPPWNIQAATVLDYTIQTTAQRGLLVYGSGTVGDFVAMEMEHGLIKAHIGKDKRRFQLSSIHPINSDQWHTIRLKFSAKHIELTVGKETVRTSLLSYGNFPILEEALYIGGVNDAVRAEVLKLELASVSGKYGGSFRGCMKDLKIGLGRSSVKNALVSKDISVGCQTASGLSSNPVVAPEKQLVGSKSPISALGTAVPSLHGKESHENFVMLNNLIVPEGGQATLESKHIKVNVEFKKLGIRQSQIVFTIRNQPSHGHLRLDVEPEQGESTFTMLDLWQDRVLYIHDGSEEGYDYFTFSVSTSSKKEMPPYLQGKKEYMFTITVRPVNDAPEITLPNGNLFLLLEHTKRCLGVDSISISDSDTSAAHLSVTVLGNLNTEAGYIENSNTPGTAVTVFSYRDLQDGRVFFVHTGVKNSRIVLRASDGEKVSNTVVLRVVAVPLEYKVVNNSGLHVLQGGTALITLSHLATETNAAQQELEVHYEITEPPNYGEIQRCHSNGEWKKTNSFSQRSLQRDQIRYASVFKEVQLDNVLEHFKFKVRIDNKISNEFLFPITVKWLKYNFLKHVPLVINKSSREYLNASNLLVSIKDVEVPENELFYKLQSLPQKGSILLNNATLQVNAIFTQQDISRNQVEYQLTSRPHGEAQDSFQFLISSKYVVSERYDFKIHIKTDPRSILLTNNGLTVPEGEGKLITESELFVQTVDSKGFQYQVTKSPHHGKLSLINFSDSPVSNSNLTSFSNQDIISKRLMYVHDDSETQYDEIGIIATAIKSGERLSSDMEIESPLTAEIKFNISVQLKNDEKPVRVIDKVFHVVRNGKKLLTLSDLCYHDPDTDFDDMQLLYTRRGIPNGDLVLVNETSYRLYQFKQADLAENRVLFIHRGADYGRFVLFITDGKHYTSSLLEVSASEPYIRLANNTGLLIQKGSEGIITTANLSAATNQDIRSDHEITFEMFLSPKHGHIFVNNLALGTFTQHDLRMGHVTYRHDDSNNLLDAFNFTVYAKGVHLNAGMNVHVYLESHQHPPAIVHNSHILVEEGKPVKINKGKLLVTHDNSLPSEIEFKLGSPPSYGYLRKFALEEGYLGTEENPVLSFTQQDINDGNIQYVQTIARQLQDQFSLDVTNGIQTVSGIPIVIDIIPKLIPLEVQNFTVAEGGSIVLEEDFLNIPNSHFAGVNFEFILIKPPTHGHISTSHFPGVALTKFTKKQLEQGLILYIHDDSEQLLDNFTIVANSTELWKHSLPQTTYVTITAVNDEAPVIKRNKILRVWVGSVTEITTNDLCAEDEDSSPEELLYSVSPPNNGHLALKSSPNKSILNFTQAHINRGQLVFVHSGAMSGGFNFQVTDGLNFAPRQIFSITARTLVVRLENNNGLEVFPGSRKTITSLSLKATTNDVVEDGNRTILFTVTNSPNLGRLISILSDNRTQDISSFTQSMVDEEVVIYEHSNKEMVDWDTQDYFTFSISSPPAVLGPQVFHINISYGTKGHDRSSQLLANTGAVVQEGGKVLINKSNLDGSNLLFKLPEPQRSAFDVWYQVICLPQHGRIIVGERNITREKPNFSQYIINKYGITYVHDDSESPADQFRFAVWLNQKSKSATKPHSGVLEESFNITVVPVNDQPPELKTKVLHLTVLQGDTVVLGPENLKVEDPDNMPEEIKYTIINNPQNGFFTLGTHLSESIKEFTQADVDGGRVWFVQDGSPLSGIFYFSVTDGRHRPLYKLFSLEVIPTSVTLVNLTEVILPQGQTTVAITNTQLSATTNGKNTMIGFEVTQPFKYGHLLISGEHVTTFQQADIDEGRLWYHMTDLTGVGDTVEFVVSTLDSNLTGQVMNITVQPLVQMKLDVSIPNKVAYQLKGSDLNATELANLTNSNPTFEVIASPVYGRLFQRPLSHTKSERLSIFTQTDLNSGAVFLQADANMTSVDVLNDSFTFILRAEGVQPAVGQFYFAVVPHEPSLGPMFSSEIPVLSSTSVLKGSVIATDGPLPTPEIYTAVLSRTQWPNQSNWMHRNDREKMLPNEEIARGRSAWAETTVKASSRSSWDQTPRSNNRLFIIIPLASVAAFFSMAAIAVCVFLMCHKPKKAKSLIAEQTAATPSSPSISPERSVTVPTVTVTPLLKEPSKTTASPFMVLGQERFRFVPVAPPLTPHLPEGPQQNTWCNHNPEVIQQCRTTKPTLKHSQYWV